MKNPRLLRRETRLDLSQEDVALDLFDRAVQRMQPLNDLRSGSRFNPLHANLHRAAPVRGHADALQRLPRVTSKLFDRSRLTLTLLDTPDGLFEDFGDLDFVLDCGKPPSEPRKETIQRLEQALI